MSKTSLWIAISSLFAAMVWLMPAHAAETESTLRIVCIGDSITQGRGDRSRSGEAWTPTFSYRYPLWKMLVDAGAPVDFVGSLSGGFEGDPDWSDYRGHKFDRDHEGHWGWKTTEVAQKLPGWIESYQADVALILLGSNDAGGNTSGEKQASVARVREAMSKIIATLRSKNGKIVVLLGQCYQPWEPFPAMRKAMVDLAKAEGSVESPIVIVDHAPHWVSDPKQGDTHTVDWVHPNLVGDQKLSGNWFEALKPYLPAAQKTTRTLPDARQVQLGGPLGDAYARGARRLAEDPYRSAPFLRSDFTFETNRVFVNYSGDISGRFTELASRMSPPGKMTPAVLEEVLRDIGRFQQADGHFGRDVDWNEPLEPENSNAKLLPIFWGNSRLLVGLLEAYHAFDRPDLLEAAKRIGDFYITTADRFLDPAREPEYRSTGSYAAGYVTDYFPGIEGLVRLYQTTRDERYLKQAQRMAEFFKRFDTLPIDHSHANLITHYGLLLLYETTGKVEYLERPRRRWREAVEGGYVWPMGGVGEKFRVSYERDEGCSEADWLRLNLRLWRLTGENRYLEMAERVVENHYGMNRAPNGGYGHHDFRCDSDGPLLVQPQFTEAVWCCTFHGLLGLHTFKSYVLTGSDKGVFVNFPVAATAAVEVGAGVISAATDWHEEPGAWTCSLKMQLAGASSPIPDLFLRRPLWADAVAISDADGTPLEAATEDGYLRLPGNGSFDKAIRATFSFAPRVEDRRLNRVVLDGQELGRHSHITIWDGPQMLLANTDQPCPALVAIVDKEGRLRLTRDQNERCQLVQVPNLDASAAEIAAAAEQPARTTLSPWQEVRHDVPAAFVFDLIVVPETDPLAKSLLR